MLYSWDPHREASERDIFWKLIHATAGVYLWEFVLSLPFELKFLTRKRKLTIPIAVYFLNRYSYLGHIIALLCASDIPTETKINCRGAFDFIQVAGNMAVGFASMTFALRTCAIWSNNRYIAVFLVLLILGQWALILQVGQLKFKWIPGQGCVNLQTGDRVLIATYIYSTLVDTVVMALSAWKLTRLSRVLPDSRFITVLFRDGLVYFAFALIGNIVITVFEVLNIDPLLNVMFNPPSIAVVTIAATRAVRNLQEVAVPMNDLPLSKENIELTTHQEITSYDGTSINSATT